MRAEELVSELLWRAHLLTASRAGRNTVSRDCIYDSSLKNDFLESEVLFQSRAPFATAAEA